MLFAARGHIPFCTGAIVGALNCSTSLPKWSKNSHLSLAWFWILKTSWYAAGRVWICGSSSTTHPEVWECWNVWKAACASELFRIGVPARQATPVIFCYWLIGSFLPFCALYFLLCFIFFCPGILKLFWRAWILHRTELHCSFKTTLLFFFLLLNFLSFWCMAFCN